MSDRICQFSPCRKYRYTLWREWWDIDLIGSGDDKRHEQYLMVIGLNPSTADETKDDPTIRRCIGFAKQWGFGALCMTNLFAWRETKPALMKLAADPVGPMNDSWLRWAAENSWMILAAWGKDGAHLGRAAEVRRLIHALQCLRVNGDGSPMHPLYAPSDIVPIPF